jgi:hypothetical protein
MLNNEIGIPQGSILGPLLFIIYINDLIVEKDGLYIVKYADDTTLICKHKNIDALIEQTNMFVNEVNLWFKAQRLKLNASKTKVLGFQLTNNVNNFDGYNIICDESEVNFSQEAKLLGLTVDNHLKWHGHIDELCKKLSSLVFALRILKDNVDVSVLKSVYYAHFHSRLVYGIEFWGRAADYQMYRIFKLQKRAIRLLSGVPPRTSCRDLFVQLNILPLPALYIYQVLMFLKKQPQYFSHSKLKHHYSTRNKNNFVLEQHRTTALEKGLLYSAQFYHNSLPNDIRVVESINKFKFLTKSWLLAKNVYKLSDF